MSRADWQITQAAKIICDFMGWTEDGPAWIDAHKLAAALYAQASPTQRSAPQNPSVDAGLLEALTFISAFADMRSKDRPPVFSRVARGALRTIAERARSAIARAESSQATPVRSDRVAELEADEECELCEGHGAAHAGGERLPCPDCNGTGRAALPKPPPIAGEV